MNHGYNSMNKITPPPFQKMIGLADGGNDYHFEGKLGLILEFMTKTQPSLKIEATGTTPGATDSICVDIYDIPLTAVQEYQKAVVSATPGANVLMALWDAVKSSNLKKVKIILRNARTAAPVAAQVRFEIGSPATLMDVAGGIAAALKPSKSSSAKGKTMQGAQVVVAIGKTTVKVIKTVQAAAS